ncbi:MAG TPA: hypothetical protein VFZ21_10285, partial [Gemmatimonadaceae bacterium]|nr:hypothetical protein [Gemmatimonadaceae bacterium]
AVQGDSIRVTEAGGTVLQGVSSGKTAARTTPERQREVPVAVGPTDAGAREALAAIQSSVIVGQTAPLRVVPPELLIDLRDRFAAGRQLADNGNYGAARQAFRAALVQIDSISSRYITSEGLRSLRNDIEQESARVLAACNAENEMHRRRGGKVQSCA